MIIVWAILASAVVYGSFLLASDYVRRSMRSYASAESVWTNLAGTAHELIESDIPASVARMILGLVTMAGCGCFVRGMLLSYYLPIPDGARSKADSVWDQSFADANKLSQEQREKFNHLLGQVMVYDSFTNPLQGWLFRRALKAFMRNEQTFAQRASTQLTVLSVLSGNAAKLRLSASNQPMHG